MVGVMSKLDARSESTTLSGKICVEQKLPRPERDRVPIRVKLGESEETIETEGDAFALGRAGEESGRAARAAPSSLRRLAKRARYIARLREPAGEAVAMPPPGEFV